MGENECFKIKIIACYMGKLPEYFDLWLLSCEKNPTIDFLVVSDQKLPKNLPRNVEFLNEDLCTIKNRFKKKLGFEIVMESAYKLCDFRPLYGVGFEKELVGYDFWGHCDIDLIWGDIREFVNNKILEENDKIFNWGHCSLFRNNEMINNLYKKEGAIFSYKEVFTNKEYYAFDEITGIKKIINKNNVKLYNYDFSANISRIYSRMRIISNNIKENYKYQVFYWENGKVIRAYIDGGIIKCDNFSYIHFQWKKPFNKVNSIKKIEAFYILPDKFIEKKNGTPSMEEIIKYAYFKNEKLEQKEKKKYYYTLIIKFLKSNIKQKIIWVKQKEFI